MQPTRESLRTAVADARAQVKSRATELTAASRLLASLDKTLSNPAKQTPAAFSSHQDLPGRLEQQGFTDLARKLVDYIAALSTGDRNSFERDFPTLCEQVGLAPLTGRLDEGYRIRGAIEVRAFFSKGHVRVSTISTALTIAPPTAPEVVHAAQALYKRLFDRRFDAAAFSQQLIAAFHRAGGRHGDSLPLRQIHGQIFLAHQTAEFLKDMSPRRLKPYPLDEFAVDIARYLDSRPADRMVDRQLTLELGRDGIIVFTSQGAFDSYKFLKVD